MRKLLLTFIVTMLALIGARAQEGSATFNDGGNAITSINLDISGGTKQIFVAFEQTGSWQQVKVISSNTSVVETTDYIDYQKSITLTPKGVGEADIQIVNIPYGSGVGDQTYTVPQQLHVKVTDASLATSLSVASTVEVAKGYTAELDVTYAPGTANGFTVSWTPQDGGVSAYLSSDYKKLTIQATASPASSEYTVTVSPKANSSASPATVAVTVVEPVSIESITLAPNPADLLIGKKVALVPTFTPENPASKKLTWTSSDESKATVDANGVVTGVARGTVTITAASENINGNPQVTATATVNVKQELAPENDVKPKTTFKVGETYESELSLADATLGTISYSSANPEVLSVDNTGKLTALKVGTANISVTIEPTDDAKADNYVAWTRPLAITVAQGEFGLALTANPTNIAQGTTGTVNVTPAVTLNGAETENTAYSIVYSLEGASSGLTIDATTGVVTVPETASVQQFVVVATLTPTDATNYKGTIGKAAVLISGNAAAGVILSKEYIEDPEGAYMKDSDGNYVAYVTPAEGEKEPKRYTIDGITVYVPTPGAFGAISDNPTIQASSTATLDELKAAKNVKVTGLLANSDVQELVYLIGGNDHTVRSDKSVLSNCLSLDMGNAKMTEAITYVEKKTVGGNVVAVGKCSLVAGVRHVVVNEYFSYDELCNYSLLNVKTIVLPQPAVGVENGTILPRGMNGLFSIWDTNSDNALESLTIPEGWTETAAGFSGYTGTGETTFQKLTSLNLPNSLEKIGAYSFSDLRVHTLYMPSGVQRIDDYAFTPSSKLADIYFTGPAPIYVSTTAFSTQTQMTNNTVDDADFNGTHSPVTTRDRYSNGSGDNKVLACILHFPSEYKSQYIDETRVYTVVDTSEESGITYGKGNQTNGTSFIPEGWSAEFMSTINSLSKNWNMDSYYTDGGFPDATYGTSFTWPSQSQMTSGYTIANAGYKWIGEPLDADQYDPSSTYENGGVDKRGLYQFIIAMPNAPKDKDKWVFPTIYEQDKWYTFSVPFDMSVEQIKNVFGANTQVCRISKVIRDTEATPNVLRLEFRKSVMQEGDGRAEDIDYSDGVTQAGIRHHYPYMIKPGAPVEELAAQFKEDGHRVLPDYESIPGNLMIETATAVTSTGTSTDKEYMFCPILMKGKIKKNSYVLVNKNNIHQFVFYKGVKGADGVYTDGGTASANTAYVQLIHGQDDFDTYFPTATINENNVKFASCFGDYIDEEDEATRIEKIEIVCGEDENAGNDKIYTINGIKVSGDSLTPGLYIKNGKKYIVK